MKISLHLEDGDEGKVSAEVSGTSIAPLTDDEIKLFDIADASLKDIIGKKMDKNPDDAYTSGGDQWNLHEKYDWDVVTSNVQYKNAEVLEMTSELAAMAHKNLKNKSSVTGTFGGTLNVTVAETTSTTWIKSLRVGIGTSISYDVGGTLGKLATGMTAEFSTTFDSTIGKNTTVSKMVSIGDTISISVALAPGQSVKAVLMTTKHVLKLRVHYNVSLEGKVAINYNPPHKGPESKDPHHFYGIPIVEALKNADMPHIIEQYEDIEMTSYSGSHTELFDYDEDDEAAAAELAADKASKAAVAAKAMAAAEARATDAEARATDAEAKATTAEAKATAAEAKATAALAALSATQSALAALKTAAEALPYLRSSALPLPLVFGRQTTRTSSPELPL